MVGKVFLLLAVACVCLAQGPEGSLENAIKRGTARATSLSQAAEKRVESALKDVSYKQQLIQSKAADFIQRAQKTQAGVEEALSSVAEATRKKAEESKKPQSVFECIDRVEENAKKNVDSLTKKFGEDIKRVERVKLENIDTYSKPLNDMAESIKGRYEKAVSIIKDAKNPEAVDIAVRSFEKWLDLLYLEISRIQRQIGTAITNFQRDASNLSTNTNRQINRIKSSSLKNIRLCLLNREAVFEKLE